MLSFQEIINPLRKVNEAKPKGQALDLSLNRSNLQSVISQCLRTGLLAYGRLHYDKWFTRHNTVQSNAEWEKLAVIANFKKADDQLDRQLSDLIDCLDPLVSNSPMRAKSLHVVILDAFYRCSLSGDTSLSMSAIAYARLHNAITSAVLTPAEVNDLIIPTTWERGVRDNCFKRAQLRKGLINLRQELRQELVDHAATTPSIEVPVEQHDDVRSASFSMS